MTTSHLGLPTVDALEVSVRAVRHAYDLRLKLPKSWQMPYSNSDYLLWLDYVSYSFTKPSKLNSTTSFRHERHPRVSLAHGSTARPQRKGRYPVSSVTSFLTILTDSAVSHPVVCQSGHIPPPFIVRRRDAPDDRRAPTLYVVRRRVA